MNTTTRTPHVSILAMALGLGLLSQAAAAQTLPAAGTTTTNKYLLPNALTTAEEHPWTVRILAHHPDPVVPRRMYTATCNANGTRKFFASMTTVNSNGVKQGALLSADVLANGTIQGISTRSFSGCNEMSGVAADASCTTVVAMCRKPSNATGATKDLVAPLNTAATATWFSNLTQSGEDQLWLYEWKGTTTAPATPTNTNSAFNSYIVSKAIGGWEYGHQAVAITGTHYGVSIKTTAGTHEGDMLVAVRRNATPANVVIDTARGWSWECAPGHTNANRLVVNSSGQFTAFCSTDRNVAGTDPVAFGGIWTRIEGSTAQLAQPIFKSTVYNVRKNGGGTSIIPRSDGTFIGVIAAGVDGNSTPVAGPSKIGLFRMSSTGARTFRSWLKSSNTHFLSYPQLAFLGNDNLGNARFLLGWSQMMPSNANSTLDSPKPDQTQRLATKYFVQEINADGAAKTQVLEIVNGWGEQDQMVSLGGGKVGWVNIPDPRIKLSADGASVSSKPSPNSTHVQWTVYQSALN